MVLTGPRQSGKTTLAREFVEEESVNYFDLEDPASLARLDEPMTALRPLRGLVVIDEVQRRPALFPVLRVLSKPSGSARSFLGSGECIRGLDAPDLGKFGWAHGVVDHRWVLSEGTRSWRERRCFG